MAVTIGPHTLTRGELVPIKYKSRTRQTAQVAGDASVAVSGSSITERFFRIRCKLPRAEAAKIITYIENSLRYQAETVAVIDGYGVTRTMRYWSDEVDATTLGGAIIELDLPFRQEVPA